MSGFTLVEIAIALTIIAILSIGSISLLSTQREVQRLVETRTTLSDAQEAIILFAAAYQRLPCPADPSASGTDAGKEARSGSICVKQRGWFPWKTLGQEGLDGWNHRLVYDASSNFTNAAITLNTEGEIAIVPTASNMASAIIEERNVAFALWSLGPNGRYGVDRDGHVVADSSGTNSDEDNNKPTERPASAKVVFRDATDNTAGGGEFDDIVIWTSRYGLFGRMIAAGVPPSAH